jgi:DNA-binding XRE family transcriptional regulator
MVRLLIEDATLIKAAQLTVHVRLKGGATRTLALPLPRPACRTWQTDGAVVKQVDTLLNSFTGAEVAKKLNAQGLQSGKGGSFKRMTVYNICQSYGLKSHYQRLRERAFLTRKEMASALGISKSTVSAWKRAGLLKAKLANDKGQYLYEPVNPENRPEKRQGRKLNDRREQILTTE